MSRGLLARFAIDDGRHLPVGTVVDERVSAAAGETRYSALCSCGHRTQPPVPTPELALASYASHVRTRVGPSRGPAWMPLGVRITLLMVACLAVCMAAAYGGYLLSRHYEGPAALLLRGGGVLAGFAGAGCLMVALRRYIAPTRG